MQVMVTLEMIIPKGHYIQHTRTNLVCHQPAKQFVKKKLWLLKPQVKIFHSCVCLQASFLENTQSSVIGHPAKKKRVHNRELHFYIFSDDIFYVYLLLYLILFIFLYVCLNNVSIQCKEQPNNLLTWIIILHTLENRKRKIKRMSLYACSYVYARFYVLCVCDINTV